MTTWQGVEPFELELSLLFDGFASPYRSQETLAATLMRVARGDDESPPGIAHDRRAAAAARRRVGDRVDRLRRRDLAHERHGRVRQPVTLTLREYVPPEYKQLRRRALQGSKGKTKIVTASAATRPRRSRVACTASGRRFATSTAPTCARPIRRSSRARSCAYPSRSRSASVARARARASASDDRRRRQHDAQAVAAQWQRWEQVGLKPHHELDELVLNWTDHRVKDLDALGALVSLSLERTIEGGSTITMTLRDPDRQLFRQRADARARSSSAGARPRTSATPCSSTRAGSRCSRPTSSGARWRSSSTASSSDS
jgi:hypothetical protein